MNLANKLTMFRFVLLPLFVLAMAIKGQAAKSIALFIFGLAALTDLYDGWIARLHRTETSWGKFMDPIADKLLVISGLIFFVGLNLIPAWTVVLIVVRELGITALRLVALLRGVVISASGEGKIKNSVQMVTVILILILVILKEGDLPLAGLSLLVKVGPLFLVSITLFLSLFSGANYILRHKELIFPVER